MSNPLAHIIPPYVATERSLAELEQIVERGLTTFVEIGQALAEISERRLYREQGFATFEAYCAERWGWSSTNAYKYIRAAEVAGNVSPVTQPASLRQAVELAPLPPDQQREVAAAIDFSKATVREVREAVREHRNDAPDLQRAARRAEAQAESRRAIKHWDLRQQTYSITFFIEEKLNHAPTENRQEFQAAILAAVTALCG